MNTERIIREGRGTVVDVRSPQEFRGGHVAGSVNIPLQELQMRTEELRSLQTPLVLCCASGNRSGMAEQLLASLGIECINGGSWLDVNYYKSQTI